MISRIVLTLALASSFALTAAQEKPKTETVKTQQKLAKNFSKIALTAAVLTTGVGLGTNHPGLTGCGIGLLTGLACAAYENKPDGYPILSWIPEIAARAAIIGVIFGKLPMAAIQPILGGSTIGAWIGYLGYHTATYIDKE